jgi:hypothetical protein
MVVICFFPNLVLRYFQVSVGFTKNSFAILGVEAPGWQGAKTQDYMDIPSFRNTAGRDASASIN